MLINIDYLVEKYNFHPKAIIQVGCNTAQEHDELIRIGVEKFVYIEPCQNAFDSLISRFGFKPNIKLIQCACGASEFEAEMNVETVNGGQSNSLLNPKDHLIQHPSIIFHSKEKVKVKRLDSLIPDYGDFDFLMADVQGYELEVLKGAQNILQTVKFVYLELNRSEVYEGCAHYSDIDHLLFYFGFDRVETQWVGNWGDGFYSKNNRK